MHTYFKIFQSGTSLGLVCEIVGMSER